MAQILSKVDNKDGTTTVTIGTVDHGQAVVTVPNDQLDSADLFHLYAHAADIAGSPYVADRRSGRDRRRSAPG